MKVALVFALCLGCLLAGYLVGHVNGNSLATRSEITSSMIFLSIARAKMEKGEQASAVQALDRGLDAGGDTLLKFEKTGAKFSLIGPAVRPGVREKEMAEMQTKIGTSLGWQVTPVPEKVYLALKVPVVPGNPLTATSGGMPTIPEEGGAPAPGSSPGSTITPSPAPKQPQLPPGIERRQR